MGCRQIVGWCAGAYGVLSAALFEIGFTIA
jgi:hypothetical protein